VPEQKAHRMVGFLAVPHHQNDVGRIISDGFATLKNFSDWILNFSEPTRQVKIGQLKTGPQREHKTAT
jgi:hypothetical protein